MKAGSQVCRVCFWSACTDFMGEECDETLTSLHLYTRTIRSPNTDPLTTKRGLSIVGRYAFDNDNVSLSTSRIAARCLNNIIVLAEPMRQVFVDEQYPQKVIQRLKVSSSVSPMSVSSGPASDHSAFNRKETRRTSSRALIYYYSPQHRRPLTLVPPLSPADLRNSSTM